MLRLTAKVCSICQGYGHEQKNPTLKGELEQDCKVLEVVRDLLKTHQSTHKNILGTFNNLILSMQPLQCNHVEVCLPAYNLLNVKLGICKQIYSKWPLLEAAMEHQTRNTQAIAKILDHLTGLSCTFCLGYGHTHHYCRTLDMVQKYQNGRLYSAKGLGQAELEREVFLADEDCLVLGNSFYGNHPANNFNGLQFFRRADSNINSYMVEDHGEDYRINLSVSIAMKNKKALENNLKITKEKVSTMKSRIE